MPKKEDIKRFIEQTKEPLKGVPFGLVIEGLSDGCKIIPFDITNKDDIVVLDILKSVAILAGKQINEKGIISKRPNEVGNKIEVFVKSAFEELGYRAEVPSTANNKQKSSGYPDLLFYDHKGTVHYLECKTYNTETENQTMRTFFVSPTENPKIICDAHHFLLSFEMYRVSETVYKTKSYKIVSLDDLLVDLKYEFNANNVALYKEVLASGEIVENME